MRCKQKGRCEPTIDEILADDTVRLLMASDNVDEASIRALVRNNAEKARRQYRGSRAKTRRFASIMPVHIGAFVAQRVGVKRTKLFETIVWQSTS